MEGPKHHVSEVFVGKVGKMTAGSSSPSPFSNEETASSISEGNNIFDNLFVGLTCIGIYPCLFLFRFAWN